MEHFSIGRAGNQPQQRPEKPLFATYNFHSQLTHTPVNQPTYLPTCFCRFALPHFHAIITAMPPWWNWHTQQVEGLCPNGRVRSSRTGGTIRLTEVVSAEPRKAPCLSRLHFRERMDETPPKRQFKGRARPALLLRLDLVYDTSRVPRQARWRLGATRRATPAPTLRCSMPYAAQASAPRPAPRLRQDSAGPWPWQRRHWRC